MVPDETPTTSVGIEGKAVGSMQLLACALATRRCDRPEQWLRVEKGVSGDNGLGLSEYPGRDNEKWREYNRPKQ